MRKRIAIFASGEGTNTENIIHYFQNNKEIEIAFVLYNRIEAGVHLRAKKLGIQTEYISSTDFRKEEKLFPLLDKHKIDYIVLAGFLLFIPTFLIQKFPNKILNIHPSLLPLYGGKGMYGNKIHEEIIKNKEKKTGITIHLVTATIDGGKQIFQASCDILPSETVEDVAQKVHILEYKYYPKVIENYIKTIS